jgi:hypothetical protein
VCRGADEVGAVTGVGARVAVGSGVARAVGLGVGSGVGSAVGHGVGLAGISVVGVSVAGAVGLDEVVAAGEYAVHAVTRIETSSAAAALMPHGCRPRRCAQSGKR